MPNKTITPCRLLSLLSNNGLYHRLMTLYYILMRTFVVSGITHKSPCHSGNFGPFPS